LYPSVIRGVAPDCAPLGWTTRLEKSPWNPVVPGAVSVPRFRYGVKSTVPEISPLTVANALDPYQLAEALIVPVPVNATALFVIPVNELPVALTPEP